MRARVPKIRHDCAHAGIAIQLLLKSLFIQRFAITAVIKRLGRILPLNDAIMVDHGLHPVILINRWCQSSHSVPALFTATHHLHDFFGIVPSLDKVLPHL